MKFLDAVHDLDAKMTEICGKYVGDFSADDCYCMFDTDFFYEYLSNTIHYSLITSVRNSRTWKEWLEHLMERELDQWDCFCLAVLHEIGHHITIGEIDEEDYVIGKQEETELRLMGLEKEEYDRRYYQLPLESIATRWAVDFTGRESYEEFKEEVMMAIDTFYAAVGAEKV